VLTLALYAGSGYGGAEKLALEFARRLDPTRYRSWLCTIRLDDPSRDASRQSDARDLSERGVRWVGLQERAPTLASPHGWWRLLTLLTRERIDVVHAHMPRASVPGAIAARLARVPVVVSHEHGSTLSGKRMRPLLDREVVARLSTIMIAVSEYDRQNLIAREGIASERIMVLHNGIDGRLGDDSAGPPPGLERPPGVPLIGAVGRLFAQKDYANLVRAVAVLRERGRALRCVILGDGPQRAQLEALISQIGVGDSVRLLGRRDDVGQVLRAFDVAVLSSVWEGTPLAGLEYMAAGRPIVATAVGGVPEMLRDGVDGILVPPRDHVALADGIARVLDDPELAARLGASAQARQAESYELDGVVRRLEGIYDELLVRQGRPPAAA
jgi:glycosyltransferase involved in cell wall biosynthesis